MIAIARSANNAPLPYAEAIHRWQVDPAFRIFIAKKLTDLPYGPFKWEVPPVTAASAGRPFEFVALDCPELDIPSNPAAYVKHLDNGASGQIAELRNPGGDAILIAPCPNGSVPAYSHLGSFLREAPKTQVHALWACIGAAIERRLGDRPVWVSTAGLGVPWLHVRLDDRPKHGHQPYRKLEEGCTAKLRCREAAGRREANSFAGGFSTGMSIFLTVPAFD